MDNKVEKYVHDEFGELEILQVGDKFWFPARKCAEILGHQNPERAVRTHCKGVTEMVTPSSGGSQKTKYITEGDLYRLIIRSNLDSAQRFEEWMKKFMKKIVSAVKNTFAAVKNIVKEAVENTKEVVDTIVCRSRLAVANNRAEGYVDSGVKILIAVVIGALLLAGLYALFNTTIMPTVTSKITDLFNFKG